MRPEPTIDPRELARGVRARDKASIARALNLVEDRRPSARATVGALLGALREETRRDDAPRGARVGLTGPPGVGKSSLAAALARQLRRDGRSVGIVAIDPSSVKSGGALLGDRARMGFDPTDNSLFVRSLATGGEAGGLSWSTPAAVHVLGAAYDVVLVETTGVGQTETDVRHVADTVVLVIQPGSGDVLQFLKAGVMEIPDVLAVNKADHEELARRALADLRGALHSLSVVGASRELPLVATSASTGRGVEELVAAIDAHHAELASRLAEHRADGERAWTTHLFVRLHGEHGVTTLGGRAALLDAVRDELAKDGASAPTACAALSARFLATVQA